MPADEIAIFTRTISLSSENQSETFFSAEEELSHNRNSIDSNALERKSPTSRSSSLRNSVISSTGSYTHNGSVPRYYLYILKKMKFSLFLIYVTFFIRYNF